MTATHNTHCRVGQCDCINALLEETLHDDLNKKYQILHTELGGSTKALSDNFQYI